MYSRFLIYKAIQTNLLLWGCEAWALRKALSSRGPSEDNCSKIVTQFDSGLLYTLYETHENEEKKHYQWTYHPKYISGKSIKSIYARKFNTERT